MSEHCNDHGNNCERIKALETKVEAHDLALRTIDRKLDDIVKMLQGRPSWMVCIIITLLMSTCSILATILCK